MPAITSIPDPRPPAETPGLAAASTTSAVSRLRDQLASSDNGTYRGAQVGEK
jgi:hypothetical protein